MQERGEARERGRGAQGERERNREQARSKRTSMYDMITKRGRDHYRPLGKLQDFLSHSFFFYRVKQAELSQEVIKIALTRTGPQFLEEKKILLLGKNLLLFKENQYYFRLQNMSKQ